MQAVTLRSRCIYTPESKQTVKSRIQKGGGIVPKTKDIVIFFAEIKSIAGPNYDFLVLEPQPTVIY